MLATLAVDPLPAGSPTLYLLSITLALHIAGTSVRAVTVAAKATAEEIRRYIAGEPSLDPC